MAGGCIAIFGGTEPLHSPAEDEIEESGGNGFARGSRHVVERGLDVLLPRRHLAEFYEQAVYG